MTVRSFLASPRARPGAGAGGSFAVVHPSAAADEENMPSVVHPSAATPCVHFHREGSSWKATIRENGCRAAARSWWTGGGEQWMLMQRPLYFSSSVMIVERRKAPSDVTVVLVSF
jgi:hypothetical protein